MEETSPFDIEIGYTRKVIEKQKMSSELQFDNTRGWDLGSPVKMFIGVMVNSIPVSRH